MTNGVELIRLCGIAPGKGPAKYEFDAAVNIDKGKDFRTIIEGWAEADEALSETRALLPSILSQGARSLDVRDSGADVSCDGLDIDLGGSKGQVAIAFRLPVPDNGSDLEFRDEPLIELRNNCLPVQTFLSFVERRVRGAGRWASVVCDLDAVRGSDAAEKILRHKPNGKPEAQHAAVLRIPFSLNVIDRHLGFAPWILPVEKSTSTGALTTITHGGVHPNVAYYISVTL